MLAIEIVGSSSDACRISDSGKAALSFELALSRSF